MPVDFKDYYSILGVSRAATETEIKKAFRQLARKHHPDVARDKKASEEKFKEVNEAYEVLSDPTKRRKYDELGAHWQEGGAPPPPRRSGRRNAADAEEFHFGGTGFSDFFEQFFGGRADFSGAEFRENHFAGGVPESKRGEDIEGDLLVTLDEALHGAVRSLSLEHRGNGSRRGETQTFKVRIPPGALDDQRIRVPGKGRAGHGGGPSGDLYLRVRLAAHPDFRVRGADLYHDLEVAPWDAVLGARLTVPTLTGSIHLRLPPGTENGKQLRVRGHGLRQGRTDDRGDLFVVIHLATPPAASTEERNLWEQLRDLAAGRNKPA